MKKNCKKLISLLLTFCVLFSFSLFVYADNEKVDIKSPSAIGEGNVEKAFIVKDGKLSEISVQEYEEIIKESKKTEEKFHVEKEKLKQKASQIGGSVNSISNDTQANEWIPWMPDQYYYRQSGFSSAVTRTSLMRRISSIIYNETGSPATRKIDYSTTQGYSVNISLNGGKKDAFSATLGGSWSSSWSKSDSISYTISSKYYGWMEYTPIMDNSWGYMECAIWDASKQIWVAQPTEWTDLYIARNMNGTPDGIYTIKTSTTRPSY